MIALLLFVFLSFITVKVRCGNCYIFRGIDYGLYGCADEDCASDCQGGDISHLNCDGDPIYVDSPLLAGTPSKCFSGCADGTHDSPWEGHLWEVFEVTSASSGDVVMMCGTAAPSNGVYLITFSIGNTLYDYLYDTVPVIGGAFDPTATFDLGGSVTFQNYPGTFNTIEVQWPYVDGNTYKTYLSRAFTVTDGTIVRTDETDSSYNLRNNVFGMHFIFTPGDQILRDGGPALFGTLFDEPHHTPPGVVTFIKVRMTSSLCNLWALHVLNIGIHMERSEISAFDFLFNIENDLYGAATERHIFRDNYFAGINGPLCEYSHAVFERNTFAFEGSFLAAHTSVECKYEPSENIMTGLTFENNVIFANDRESPILSEFVFRHNFMFLGTFPSYLFDIVYAPVDLISVVSKNVFGMNVKASSGMFEDYGVVKIVQQAIGSIECLGNVVYGGFPDDNVFVNGDVSFAVGCHSTQPCTPVPYSGQVYDANMYCDDNYFGSVGNPYPMAVITTAVFGSTNPSQPYAVNIPTPLAAATSYNCYWWDGAARTAVATEFDFTTDTAGRFPLLAYADIITDPFDDDGEDTSGHSPVYGGINRLLLDDLTRQQRLANSLSPNVRASKALVARGPLAYNDFDTAHDDACHHVFRGGRGVPDETGVYVGAFDGDTYQCKCDDAHNYGDYYRNDEEDGDLLNCGIMVCNDGELSDPNTVEYDGCSDFGHLSESAICDVPAGAICKCLVADNYHPFVVATGLFETIENVEHVENPAIHRCLEKCGGAVDPCGSATNAACADGFDADVGGSSHLEKAKCKCNSGWTKFVSNAFDVNTLYIVPGDVETCEISCTTYLSGKTWPTAGTYDCFDRVNGAQYTTPEVHCKTGYIAFKPSNNPQFKATHVFADNDGWDCVNCDSYEQYSEFPTTNVECSTYADRLELTCVAGFIAFDRTANSPSGDFQKGYVFPYTVDNYECVNCDAGTLYIDGGTWPANTVCAPLTVTVSTNNLQMTCDNGFIAFDGTNTFDDSHVFPWGGDGYTCVDCDAYFSAGTFPEQSFCEDDANGNPSVKCKADYVAYNPNTGHWDSSHIFPYSGDSYLCLKCDTGGGVGGGTGTGYLGLTDQWPENVACDDSGQYPTVTCASGFIAYWEANDLFDDTYVFDYANLDTNNYECVIYCFDDCAVAFGDNSYCRFRDENGVPMTVQEDIKCACDQVDADLWFEPYHTTNNVFEPYLIDGNGGTIPPGSMTVGDYTCKQTCMDRCGEYAGAECGISKGDEPIPYRCVCSGDLRYLGTDRRDKIVVKSGDCKIPCDTWCDNCDHNCDCWDDFKGVNCDCPIGQDCWDVITPGGQTSKSFAYSSQGKVVGEADSENIDGRRQAEDIMLTTIRGVCLNEYWGIMIDSEHELYIWGEDIYNKYLNAETDIPQLIPTDDWVGKPKKVSCTEKAVFVMTHKGALYYMGYSEFGEIEGTVRGEIVDEFTLSDTFDGSVYEVIEITTSLRSLYVMSDETGTHAEYYDDIIPDLAFVKIFAIGGNEYGELGCGHTANLPIYCEVMQAGIVPGFDLVKEGINPEMTFKGYKYGPWSYLDYHDEIAKPFISAMDHGVDISFGKYDHYFAGKSHPSVPDHPYVSIPVKINFNPNYGDDDPLPFPVKPPAVANPMPDERVDMLWYSEMVNTDYIDYIGRPVGGCLILISGTTIYVSGDAEECNNDVGIDAHEHHTVPFELNPEIYGDFLNNRERIFTFVCGYACYIVTMERLLVFGKTMDGIGFMANCGGDHCDRIRTAGFITYVAPGFGSSGYLEETQGLKEEYDVFYISRPDVYNVIHDDETYKYPPELIMSESGMDNDTLSITIRKPEVFMQMDPTIDWQIYDTFPPASNCKYPFISHTDWHMTNEEVDGAPYDYFRISLPWEDFKEDCVFEYDSKLEDYDLYYQRISFVEEFYLGMREGERILRQETYYFDIEVRFPKKILTTEIIVKQDMFSEYWNAFVIDKSFDRFTRQGWISFSVIVRNPNYFVMADHTSIEEEYRKDKSVYKGESLHYLGQEISLSENGEISTTPPISTLECNVKNCYQNFRLDFEIIKDYRVCQVPETEFVTYFRQYCHDNTHQDCIQENRDVEFSIVLSMDNLCAGVLTEEIVTEFEWDLFEDWNYQYPYPDDHVFGIGDWLYFKVSVSCDQISIEDVALHEVFIDPEERAPILLYPEMGVSPYQNTAEGDIMGFVVDDLDSATSIGFHFKIHNKITELQPEDSQVFNIEIHTQVSYRGNEETVDSRRNINKGVVVGSVFATDNLQIVIKNTLKDSYSPLPYIVVIVSIVLAVCAVMVLVFGLVLALVTGKKHGALGSKKEINSEDLEQKV